MKPWMPALVILFALAACQPQPTPLPDADTPSPTPEPVRIESLDNPYAPTLDDARFSKGPVTFNSIGLLVMAAYPDQIALSLDGSLPSPCHQLRVRVLPFTPGSGRVDVEAYSVVDRDQICEPVLKLFNENVPIGRFPPGLYELYLNDSLVGTFNGG
jgi:hypothetical protein